MSDPTRPRKTSFDEDASVFPEGDTLDNPGDDIQDALLLEEPETEDNVVVI